MITEKEFILNHAAFWHELLPTLRQYLPLANGTATSYMRPYDDRSPPESRGVVNELGFRIFLHTLRTGTPSRRVDHQQIEKLEVEALGLLRQMRHFSRVGPAALDDDGRYEAIDIAERMEIWFDGEAIASRCTAQPTFRGCGWLDTCQGDLLLDSTLVEFKAGDRPFRGMDVRQVLAYCALNFASKDYDIESISMVNPRSGKVWESTLEAICRGCAGRSAGEVLARIVDYASTPISGFLRDGL